MDFETTRPLLRITDVARILQSTKGFVEKEIAGGRLPKVKLSYKFVRVRPEDLETYLAKYVVIRDAKQ